MMKSIRAASSMSISSGLRPTALPCRTAAFANASIPPQTHNRQQKRHLSNPFSQNQTLTAQRTLHYPATTIYSIISDVASYHQFLPYCQGSVVTKYSEPAADGKRYPEEARLIIGFNDAIAEEFTSRVYCVPERIVEAVSGNMMSTLSGEEIKHHSARPPADQDPSRKDTVMASLLTRWTLKPYPYKAAPVSAAHPDNTHMNLEETNCVPGKERTEVNLAIEFTFSNPLYTAVSSAAAPKVAEKMMEAFEGRVKAVLDGPAQHAPGKRRMEGVLGKRK